MQPNQPTRAHRQLIRELKRIREDADLSGQALGDRLGWSQSKVSKIENGRTKPSMDDVAAWARECSLTEEAAGDLLARAESVATETRSWASRHGTLAERNRGIGAVERDMTGLQNFQPGVIPGLLQTAEYARRIITMLDVKGTKDVGAAVTARMDRQAVLYDTSKRFEFLLTEGVLRWRPGPRSLMLAQMDRLLSVATLPNVEIGVLPFDQEATALSVNGFTIFEVEDEPRVLVELMHGEPEVDEEGLRTYRDVFATLRASALQGDEALRFIAEIRAGYAI